MFAVSKRPRPAPVLLEDNSFQIYFVIREDERLESLVYSPYFSLGSPGFLWRLLYSPCQIPDKNGVGLFLQCGGPDTTENDKKQSGLWGCAVGFRLRLLHPSKWSSLNIDPVADTAGLLPSNISIPAFPRDHVSSHQQFFQYDDCMGTGKLNWATHALFQRGLFCDNNNNFVVMCQFDIHDGFNVIEDSSTNVPATEYADFEEALEERAAVVDKLFQCDEFLRESKTPAVVLALEKEIKTLQRTLDGFPSLDSFL